MKLITRIMLCLLIVVQAHHAFSSDEEGVPIITVLPFEVSEEGEYAYLNKGFQPPIFFVNGSQGTAVIGDQEELQGRLIYGKCTCNRTGRNRQYGIWR